MSRRHQPVSGKVRRDDADHFTITTNHQRTKRSGEIEEYVKVMKYRYEVIASAPEIGWPAIRLQPLPEPYEIILTDHGCECNCQDWIFTREHSNDPECKHIRAAKALGLLDKIAEPVELLLDDEGNKV